MSRAPAIKVVSLHTSRVYVETTVLSYLTARVPRDPIVVVHHRLTREWCDRDRHHHELVGSAIVMPEVGAGDPAMAAKRVALTEGMGRICG